MPRGDGTGPMGRGAMTGRAAGWCAGFGMPGYANAMPGRGFGMGRGFGGGGRGGWRHRFYATGLPGWMRFGEYYDAPYGIPGGYSDPELEKQMLKNQADAMEMELAAIKKRLAEFETEAESK